MGFFLSLSLLLFWSSVHAQTTGTISAPIFSERPKSKSSGNSLNIQNSQYVSYGRAYYRPGAADNNLSLALRVDEQAHWLAFKFQLTGKNELSVTENWNYGDVQDLHAEWRAGETTISVGRKLDT